jgi:hypothetical protein
MTNITNIQEYSISNGNSPGQLDYGVTKIHILENETDRFHLRLYTKLY